MTRALRGKSKINNQWLLTNAQHIHKPTSVAESVENQAPLSPINFLLRHPVNELVSEQRDSPLKHMPEIEPKQLLHVNDERDRVKATRGVPLHVFLKVLGLRSKPPQQNHRRNTVFASVKTLVPHVLRSWVPNDVVAAQWVGEKGVEVVVGGGWEVERLGRGEGGEEFEGVGVWGNGWMRREWESGRDGYLRGSGSEDAVVGREREGAWCGFVE